MNDIEYRHFLNLIMCSDPYPCKGESDMKNLANKEAIKRGYENWIIAYHEFNKI